MGGALVAALAIPGVFVAEALSVPIAVGDPHSVPPVPADMVWIVAEKCAQEAGPDMGVHYLAVGDGGFQVSFGQGADSEEWAELPDAAEESMRARACIERYEYPATSSSLNELVHPRVVQDWIDEFTAPCLATHGLELIPSVNERGEVRRGGVDSVWTAYLTSGLEIDEMLRIRAGCPTLPPFVDRAWNGA